LVLVVVVGTTTISSSAGSHLVYRNRTEPSSAPFEERVDSYASGPGRGVGTASDLTTDPGDDLATAIGRYVLGEVSPGKAAEEAGLSRWEFEEVLRDSGSHALYGPRSKEQLDAEVDVALDR
jgi:predicted HTH domain antitoxin